tara:strand:+ start:6905 stop:9007 length:2103 start_codon:yes stop_codon:yes gene_type:complete
MTSVEKQELSSSIKSEILSLKKIYEGNYQFVIPGYQRPYVWNDDDVLLLFNDIKKAYIDKETYFIGTALSSRFVDDNKRSIYELIDGQQRTTTLMLIALAFSSQNVESSLQNIPTLNEAPRLQFAIREQVQALLGSFAGLKNYAEPSAEHIEDNVYLKRINDALVVLKKEIKKLDEKLDEELESGWYIDKNNFAEFIYNDVHWINNIVPHNMDLNRLFATMNTAGIQLEQADILKAKLFKKIKSEKVQCSAIWETCEHLENYFERNVRGVFPDADWSRIKPADLSEFNADLLYPKSKCEPELGKESSPKDDENNKALTIADLLAVIKQDGSEWQNILTDEAEKEEDVDQEVIYCRSVIGFPLLLIHAYRIYLVLNDEEDIKQRLHSDRLLEIFETFTNESEEKIKAFLLILWQVRYYFDCWIIKWVERDDEKNEVLSLTYQSHSKSGNQWYINRSQRPINAFSLLQSVRNFTGERSAQYWLTPLLAQLISEKLSYKGADKDALDSLPLARLEAIDNALSLASCTQKEASFALAQSKRNFANQPETITWLEKAPYFDEAKGTSFEHYWFQKLEYVLWCKIKTDEFFIRNLDNSKFNRYRIASRNSIEHVYPQHEEYGDQLKENYVNRWGNLVLLSSGENSSYSNQDVGKKKIDFEKKTQYDSLKLAHIFYLKGHDDWDEPKVKKHQEEMLEVLRKHYEQGV